VRRKNKEKGEGVENALKEGSFGNTTRAHGWAEKSIEVVSLLEQGVRTGKGRTGKKKVLRTEPAG